MTDPETKAFDAWMAQAMAASQADDSPTAIACFQRASETRPGAGLPQFMLGAELAAIGEFAQAEVAFANATRLAPDFAMARYQLGLLQFSGGRAAIALLTWQPLLSLPATDPLPHFVNGFGALAEDRFEEALQSFRRGLQLNTANPALSSDIEKVIAGIDALRGATATTDTAAPVEGHVLLSNYQHQGRMH